jgi:mannose-6-phosphate isomerase-like protein (cupin superfamily)
MPVTEELSVRRRVRGNLSADLHCNLRFNIFLERKLPRRQLYHMPTLIAQSTRIQSAGNKPKLIDEYIGRVNSQTSAASVAHMRSPAGWTEPGQTPEFDEFTIVLKGLLRVEHTSGSLDVAAGQAVIAHAGEWLRYSTPNEGGAEYIAVCLPAFSMETVHRDD